MKKLREFYEQEKIWLRFHAEPHKKKVGHYLKVSNAYLYKLCMRKLHRGFILSKIVAKRAAFRGDKMGGAGNGSNR